MLPIVSRLSAIVIRRRSNTGSRCLYASFEQFNSRPDAEKATAVQQRRVSPPPPRPKLRYNEFYDFNRHTFDRISHAYVWFLVCGILLFYSGVPVTWLNKLDRWSQGDKGQTGLTTAVKPEA